MSLVAYDSSSDSEEESDIDDNIDYEPPSDDNDFIDKDLVAAHISDYDEDNYTFVDSSQTNLFAASKKFNLTSNPENIHALLKRKLPAPTPLNRNGKRSVIQEDDDEFLHKKPMQALEKPPRPPAKITIPSLLNFSSPLNEKVAKKLIKTSAKTTQSAFSLLSLLPTPRSEIFDATRDVPGSSKAVSSSLNKVSTTSFIPESVKNRITEIKAARSNSTKLKQKQSAPINSDDSDEECDFFSLNKKDNLPTVSSTEINDMVAKRAAQIAEATIKFDEMQTNSVEVTEPDYINDNNPGPSSNNLQFDQRAIDALVGSQAKKRRKIVDDVEIKEISSAEILPDRNEWLRSALASETTYQPKGVLVDEEPAAGTRKKHQITYLAHQAKANEAELQAMWAANRQNRRATANKYGF